MATEEKEVAEGSLMGTSSISVRNRATKGDSMDSLQQQQRESRLGGRKGRGLTRESFVSFLARWKFFFIVCILVIVQIGFSGYAIVLKASPKQDALIFSLLRDVCCFPVLLLAATIVEGPQLPKLWDIPIFIGLGLTGIFGNQLLFILGLYFTNPNYASIFQPCIPVITALLAIVFRIERLEFTRLRGWGKIFGILAATGGAIVIIVLNNDKKDHDHKSKGQLLIGNFLLLGNCTCMAVYVLLQKRFLFTMPARKEANTEQPPRPQLSSSPDTAKDEEAQTLLPSVVDEIPPRHTLNININGEDEARSSLPSTTTSKRTRKIRPPPAPQAKYPPIHVTAWAYGFGALIMILASFYYVIKKDWEKFHLRFEVLEPLSYAVFVSSALCYGLITWANKHTSSTVVTAFWPLQVPGTVLMSFLFFGDTLQWNAYLGGSLIIVGLLLVCWSKFSQEKEDEKQRLLLLLAEAEEEEEGEDEEEEEGEGAQKAE